MSWQTREEIEIALRKARQLNDCGEIGGWDIPENEDILSNVDETEQTTKPDEFCSWGKRRTNDA